jgi:hypothetical protein
MRETEVQIGTSCLDALCLTVRYCRKCDELNLPVRYFSTALRYAQDHWRHQRRGNSSKDKTAQYRSENTKGKRWRDGLVFDHAIPFRYMLDAMLALPDVTPNSVRAVLEKFDVMVLITKKEDARLNASGLRQKMPVNWDGNNPLARYEAVHMELIPNKFGP